MYVNSNLLYVVGGHNLQLVEQQQSGVLTNYYICGSYKEISFEVIVCSKPNLVMRPYFFSCRIAAGRCGPLAYIVSQGVSWLWPPYWNTLFH